MTPVVPVTSPTVTALQAAADPVIARALARGTASLPKHEERPQQLAMAEAVGTAIKQRRHLIVQAGTGTGKSLAYLVPALALGQRVVVSTATKALQDQLAHRDLPQLSRSLGDAVPLRGAKGSFQLRVPPTGRRALGW